MRQRFLPVALSLACASLAAPAWSEEAAFTPAPAAQPDAAAAETPATAVTATPEGPLDLLAALHLADEHDPNLAAVRAFRKAADSTPDIARSALLPRLVANGSDSQIRLTQSNGSTDYHSTQYQVKLSQPLFHLDAFRQYQAAKSQFSQAQANAADQTQTLLLSVSEVYFNVLRAEDTLALAQAQEAGLSKQRDQAQARFDVGLVARTDVIEAEAQRDSATAQRLSAEIAVVNARETLNAALGRRTGALAHLREVLPGETPLPDDPEAWVDLAHDRNPGLLALRYYAAAAESGKAALQAGWLPQVDLFVSYGDRHNSHNSNPLNPAVSFNSGTQQIYGLEAQWELFAGGRTVAQTQQAGYQAEATRQQALAREHQVTNQARTGFLTVKSDVQRLQARQRARDSAQLAYDSVKAGYEVGTRNIVDLLLAETNLFSARRDYANARYDYVINCLRLHAVTGQLDEALVTRINSWLAP